MTPEREQELVGLMGDLAAVVGTLVTRVAALEGAIAPSAEPESEADPIRGQFARWLDGARARERRIL